MTNKSAVKKVTITNKLGLHARPAALFVKLASSFQADIKVEKNGEEINAKSLIGLLMLAAGVGSTLKLSADGEDGEEAIDALVELIESKFDEE